MSSQAALPTRLEPLLSPLNEKQNHTGEPPMNRRDLLRAAAAFPLTQIVVPRAALAQTYPARNITMIVPFPAGGQADLAARPVAMALERILGKAVIVDNRAGGGGGAVGTAAAARSEPDGY